MIEAPIWKTSYRLVMDDKEKPYLQGWAMVENPTDEDWAGVKMALISGRPISFRMDLYNPLYINRPDRRARTLRIAAARDLPGGDGRPGLGLRRKWTDSQFRAGIQCKHSSPARPAAIARGNYDAVHGPEPGSGDNFMTAPGSPLPTLAAQNQNTQQRVGLGLKRLARTQLRREYGEPELNGLLASECGNAATAASLGDFFQYTIDHPVSLARQKSALLPSWASTSKASG